MLTEEELEVNIGDYLHRLRMAARAKHEYHFLSYGPITVNPKEDHYRFRDIDGRPMARLERDGQTVEELVSLFDEKYAVALTEL